jgi:phosphoribosylanthranilate isomerase
MARVHFKICCIQDRLEAALAVSAGAYAIGLVSAMPSGPGPIADERIRDIAPAVPASVATFLLTSRRTAAGIAEQHAFCGTTHLQLVDTVEPGAWTELRRRRPGTRLVQVIHVHAESSLADAVAAAPHVDAILLDSGNQALPVKELGGTGRVHDWAVSRRIVEAVAVPVFLAGGLRPDNVAEAIRVVRPFGVDVCSGVRTGGRLDPVKLSRFVEAVGQA